MTAVLGETAASRLLWALADPDASFTRAQVAWLMSNAMRWGYEHRVDEENAAHAERWPSAAEGGTRREDKVFTGGRWYSQAERRDAYYAQARKPRPGDFPGGLPIPPTYMTRDEEAPTSNRISTGPERPRNTLRSKEPHRP